MPGGWRSLTGSPSHEKLHAAARPVPAALSTFRMLRNSEFTVEDAARL
jgi:hypothetical protein